MKTSEFREVKMEIKIGKIYRVTPGFMMNETFIKVTETWSKGSMDEELIDTIGAGIMYPTPICRDGEQLTKTKFTKDFILKEITREKCPEAFL